MDRLKCGFYSGVILVIHGLYAVHIYIFFNIPDRFTLYVQSKKILMDVHNLSMLT